MKQLKINYAFFILLANLAISAWFIYQIWDDSEKFKQEKLLIADLLSFNERLLDVKESIPLFGEWTWSHKKEKYEQELRLAEEVYDSARFKVLMLIIVNLFFLFFAFFLYYKENKWFAVTFSLVMVALVFYFAGLFTPMLEIEAFKEDLVIKLELDPRESLSMLTKEINAIPFLGESIAEYMNGLHESLPEEPLVWQKVYPGRMYFFYENKNVLDLFSTLIETRNYPVAILIALFTFVIPMLKLSFTLKMLFTPHKAMNRTSNFIHYLTKFSMVDVVIIAVFITYFSLGNLSAGVQTEANVLMGVYFFAAYVICAVLSGISFDRYKLQLQHEYLKDQIK
jgi:hypothetical protein